MRLHRVTSLNHPTYLKSTQVCGLQHDLGCYSLLKGFLHRPKSAKGNPYAFSAIGTACAFP